MVFVQYYKLSTGYDYKTNSFKEELKAPIPACGDRAVLVLDGRQSLKTWHNDAKAFNGIRRNVYCGYVLYKGESFTRAKPVSEYVSLIG